MRWRDPLQRARPYPFTNLAGETRKRRNSTHHSLSPGERLPKAPKAASSMHASPTASDPHLPPAPGLGGGFSREDHFLKTFNQAGRGVRRGGTLQGRLGAASPAPGEPLRSSTRAGEHQPSAPSPHHGGNVHCL